MDAFSSIEINLDHIQDGLRLQLDAKLPDTIFDATDSAEENGEARFQILEGCFYFYSFNIKDYYFSADSDQVVQSYPRSRHTGTIAPNTYVGTLLIALMNGHTGEKSSVSLEVQSVKSHYRSDYRTMLEFITEKCTDLLLDYGSPVVQYFEPDFDKDYETLYQRFSFVKSVVLTNEFSEAVHRIVTSPVSNWTSTSEEINIGRIKKVSGHEIRRLMRSENRLPLSEEHYLRQNGLHSLPEKITVSRKTDSIDTPENRFVKYVIESILQFCTEIYDRVPRQSALSNESAHLIGILENQLQHSVFNAISKPSTLRLNSPVLQRKEGYREILRVWLIFQLAAKLIWEGGNDIYLAGKKDLATLYEYWVFFVLLEVVRDVFTIESRGISDLLETTPDGINLRLRQGRPTSLRGTYDSGNGLFNVRFSYNRSFRGNTGYPGGGSWTTTMRPDYTLSIWPEGVSESMAETRELLVHIHFDAKYKLANFSLLTDNITESGVGENGLYKNTDLLKMHAYRDGIRGTAGAYVVYPGNHSVNYRTFHEIIPGLGAFPLSPSRTAAGVHDLKLFILEILEHLNDRSSQFAKMSRRSYEVHSEEPQPRTSYTGAVPSYLELPEGYIPDEIPVVTGFFQNDDHYQWLLNNGLYNLPYSDEPDFTVGRNIIGAGYLLLLEKNKDHAVTFWKIRDDGFKLYSKETLESLKIPFSVNAYNAVLAVESIKIEAILHKEIRHDLIRKQLEEKDYEGFKIYNLKELLQLLYKKT